MCIRDSVKAVGEKSVILQNVKRLWFWKGAFTLNEVATIGIGSGSRVSIEVEEIGLTEVIEYLPTTEKARGTYEKYIE